MLFISMAEIEALYDLVRLVQWEVQLTPGAWCLGLEPETQSRSLSLYDSHIYLYTYNIYIDTVY